VGPVFGPGRPVDHDTRPDDVADGEAVVDATGDADDHDVIDVPAVQHAPCRLGGAGSAHAGGCRYDGGRTRPTLVDPGSHRRRRRPQAEPLHQRPQFRRHRCQHPDSHAVTLPCRAGPRRS
jgi:hypothetical protein